MPKIQHPQNKSVLHLIYGVFRKTSITDALSVFSKINDHFVGGFMRSCFNIDFSHSSNPDIEFGR